MKRRVEKRELTEDERSVVIAVRHCARELGDFLQGARLKAQKDSKSFSSSGITTFSRAILSYAEMYEKLGLKSRTELYKVFARSRDCDDLQDTQDALEDVEGLMKNFLLNLDNELQPEFEAAILKRVSDYQKPARLHLGQEFDTKSLILFNLAKNRETTLSECLSEKNVSHFLLFCPCYVPDMQIRYRMDQIKKVKEDFDEFRVSYLVITWGPQDEVKDWARGLRKHCPWPILYDQHCRLPLTLNFKRGLSRLWSPEGLEFCGLQKTLHEWPVNPPSLDLNYLKWPFIGAEMVLSTEVIDYSKTKNTRVHLVREFDQLSGSDRMKKRIKRLTNDSSSEDEDRASVGNTLEVVGPQLPLSEGVFRVALFHRCSNLSDMANQGAIYQAILSCYAKNRNTSELVVMDRIREARKLRIAPDKSRLEKQEGQQMMFDPQTELFFDEASGFFWDARSRRYLRWSEEKRYYECANQMLQAQAMANHMEQMARVQAETFRAVQEKEKAMKAASQVVAQLAAIRANKDDYSAYTYRTCIEPQAKELLQVGPQNLLENASQTGLRVQQDIDRMVQQQKAQLAASQQNLVNYAYDEDELPPGVDPDD
ncbi:hypothetical protein Ciccas_012269 [Cichlidogyrus casuarinus]|uniref:Uncharacterized protein n=1 Tax=Cichlidogyrus casuarinus TaxID=1844966 RepID=A0ABD2PPC1_9PLAT